MKMIRRLKRRKGFTLTELVVVIILLAVIMAAVVGFSQPVRNLVTGVNEKSDGLTITAGVGTYLEHTLAYASKIDIYEGVTYTDLDSTLQTWATNSGNPRRCGAIVFKYTEDDRNASKQGSTYVMYDIVLNGANKYTGTTFPALPENLSDLYALTAGSDAYKYLAFIPEYYSKYQVFVGTLKNSVQENKTRDYKFLDLIVNSYYFDPPANLDLTDPANRPYRYYLSPEVLSSGFTAEEGDGYALAVGGDGSPVPKPVKGYYDYLGDDAANDDPLDLIREYRTASESVSFALQNCKSPSITRGKTTEVVDAGGNTVTTTTYGKDLVIFYDVQEYKYPAS